MACDATGPGIMHGCEAMFAARANAAPDAVLGGDEVSEAFADEGEAAERARVVKRGLE